MTVKALRKQLMAAIAMVVVAAVALSSSTYAWFASNSTVSATNMQVTATTSGSLVITNSQLPVETTGTITVASSDDGPTALIPTTHNLTLASTTGLVYNTNPGQVSASTGLQENIINELTFEEATNGPGNPYYVDYTVYIASSGQELANQDITIELTNEIDNSLMGATSVDFYAKTVTETGSVPVNSDNFKGTLNLAGKDASANDMSDKTSQKITNITIPKSGTGEAIAVTMRVYIDGALKETESSTYVKNIKVSDISNKTLGVSFTASPTS